MSDARNEEIATLHVIARNEAISFKEKIAMSRTPPCNDVSIGGKVADDLIIRRRFLLTEYQTLSKHGYMIFQIMLHFFSEYKHIFYTNY